MFLSLQHNGKRTEYRTPYLSTKEIKKLKYYEKVRIRNTFR